MVSKQEVAKKYIEFLHKGDIKELVKLFSKDAMVDSPIYGIKNAQDFFKILSDDTSESTLKTHGIFDKENSNEIALYFEYLWHLKNGASVKFDVVDIMKFNNKKKIIHLKIIYDTIKARPLLTQ